MSGIARKRRRRVWSGIGRVENGGGAGAALEAQVQMGQPARRRETAVVEERREGRKESGE